MAAMNISKKQFQEMIQGEKPVLVDFWAPWCGYCRRIEPSYKWIADSCAESLTAVKVNIDEEPELTEQEQVEVIPTLVMYRNGEAIGSIVVPESKGMIEEFILQTLEKLKDH